MTDNITAHERMEGRGPGIVQSIPGNGSEIFHVDTNYTYGLDLLCRKFIKPRYEVLELGTNRGVSAMVFAKYSANVTTIDSINHPKVDGFEQVDNIKYIQEDIYKFAETHKKKYDFIYLDAGHKRGYIQTQLQVFPYFVKEGGCIGGHDYGTACGSGVMDIVRVRFPNKKIHLFPDSSWLIRKI